jgi:hypothetical protein
MNVEGFTSSINLLHRPQSRFKLLSQNDAYASTTTTTNNNNNNASRNGEERTLEEMQLQMIEEKLKQVANRRMEMAKQLEAAELERSRLAAEVQKAKKELVVEQDMQRLQQEEQTKSKEQNKSIHSQIQSKSSNDNDDTTTTTTTTTTTESSQTVPLDSKVPKDIHNTVDMQLEKQDTKPKDSNIDPTTSNIDQRDESKKVPMMKETKSDKDPMNKEPQLEPELELEPEPTPKTDQDPKPTESSSEASTTSVSPPSLQEEQKNSNHDQVLEKKIDRTPQKEKNDLILKRENEKEDVSNLSESTKNKKKTLMEYFSEQDDINAKKETTSDTKMNKNETLFEYLNQHKIDRKEEYNSNPKAMNMADYIKENQLKEAETVLKDFERKLQSGEMEGQVQEKLKIAQDQLKGVQKQLEEYKDSSSTSTSSSSPWNIPDMKWNDSISNDLYSKISLPTISADEIISKLKSLTGDEMVTIGTPMASFVLFAALRSALEDRPVKKAEMDQERQMMQDSNTSSVKKELREKWGNPKQLQESKATKSSYSKWEEPIVPRKEDDDVNTQEMIYYQSPSKSTLYDSEPFVSYNAPSEDDDDEFQVEEESTTTTTQMEDESSLPEGWYEYIDPASGNPYYWNENTGVTTWDNPS